MSATASSQRDLLFGGLKASSKARKSACPMAVRTILARGRFERIARRTLADPRVVQGFIISRDGQPVGRIDFEDNSRNGGTITAPTADADGRRAVLYIALQLHAMPDLYSSTERERYLNR